MDVRPCQEYYLELVVSFAGWGGMIFTSSTQLSGSAPINVEVYNGSVLLAAFVASDKTGAGELQVTRSVDDVVDVKDGLVAGNVERLSYRGFLIKVPQ